MSLRSRFGKGSGRRRSSGEGARPQKGARYIKLADRNHIWVVDKVYQPEGLKSPHAVLVREDSKAERIIIAQSVLLDTEVYVPEGYDD